MAKETSHPANQLFTVRFWLEGLGDGQREWRGRVQHIGTGETIYFRDWDELLKFFRNNLNGAIKSESNQDQGGSR